MNHVPWLQLALVGGLGATGSLSYAVSSVAAAARVVTRTAESNRRATRRS